MEALTYVNDELRKAAEGFYRSADEAEETRKGVLVFAANAIQCASEVARTLQEPIAGWRVTRTMWHSAGCLAYFLFDERGHQEIAALLDLDCDIRAKRVFLRETIDILGEAEARRLISSTSPRTDREKGSVVRAQAQPRGGWDSIRVKDLQRALCRMCEHSLEHGKQLRVLLKQANVARTWGDDLAHPNLFGVCTTLGLVDIESGMIAGCPRPQSNDVGLRRLLAINLLLVHCAAIAIRSPFTLDLAQLFKETDRRISASTEEPD